MTRTKRAATLRTVTLAEYGADVIAERIAGMVKHADGVRARDVEALHDMRVASRRLRAALAIFEPVFTDPAFPDLQREVKGITRALGEARDLDVMGLRLESLAAALPPGEDAGVRDLATQTGARRATRQAGVDAALDRLAACDLAGLFTGIVKRIADRRRWLQAGTPQPGQAAGLTEATDGAQ